MNSNGTTRKNNEPSKVVAMIASAGGLAPLQTVLSSIPDNTGATFFVLQHLAPNQESYLAGLIAQRSAMPVRLASDGEEIRANTIYLGPPGQLVTLDKRVISLKPHENSKLRSRIFDIFLESLSQQQHEQAIAVVLSGAGDDGRRGAAILRHEGGLVLVQAPETADFRSMPEHVIGISAPDLILPPDKIAPMLVALLNEGKQGPTLASNSSGYLRIMALLRQSSKVDFSRYKTATMQRRINRRMMLNNIPNNLEAYLDILEQSEEERQVLARDLLIGVSAFFRDPDVFEQLKVEYLPSLMMARQQKELRIWVAGCATGEEAYSLAMLCQAYLETSDLGVDVKILASDINQEAIRLADQGIYTESQVELLSGNYLERYFHKVAQGYQVNDEIRKRVTFFQHDLTEDIPFSHIDLISCRNVFIYLNPEVQRHVLRCFGFGLRMGGILVLSPSESLGSDSHFEVQDERLRIYRLVSKPRLIQSTLPGWRRVVDQLSFAEQKPASQEHGVRDDTVRERLLQLIAGRYVPLLLVLNDQEEIIYTLGDSEGILHYASGEPVNDLSRLTSPSLRLPLTTGMRNLVAGGDEQLFRHVPVRRGENETLMDIRMCKLPVGFPPSTLFAILFEKIQPSAVTSDIAVQAASIDVDSLTQQRLSDLEEELYYTKQSLRNAVEELEVTNEELQSTNEELQSANEELQSTNEELQSTNEELIVVNSEYQQKVSELSRLNDDISNLMLSANVVTLFVDLHRKIRQASPGAYRILHLIEQDIGRPVEHVAHKLLKVNFVDLIDRVLSSGKNSEIEDQTEDGQVYVIRAHPFMTSEGVLSGVTLNFLDITNIRRTEAEMRRLANVVTHSNDAIIVQNFDGRILSWNRGAEKMYGYTEAEALQLNSFQLIPDRLLAEAKAAMDQVSSGLNIGAVESKRITKTGQEMDVRLTYTCLEDDSKYISMVATTEHDITRRKKLSEEVRMAAVAFQTIDGITVTDAKGCIQRVNKAFTAITGYTEEEVLGKNPSILHSGRQDQAFYREMWHRLLSEGTWSGEIWNKNKQGQIYPEWLTINAVKDEAGEVSHYIGVFRDISEKKAHEAQIHRLAFFDPLTELPNRRLFLERFGQSIAICKRRQSLGALLFIDLDRFKTINDSLGHSVGDELLRQVGSRLNEVLRTEDAVARIGGDEFVIVVTDIGANKHEAGNFAEKVAHKVLRVFDKPFVAGKHELHTSPSIGVTLFPAQDDTSEDFLRQADNAMYLAKKMGRNTIRFFDPSLQAAADAWLEMERALRVAVREHQFVLHYQPQFNARQGCMAAEALIRWNHPVKGRVGPDDFIPVCEDTGLIQEVGRWVIEEACAQLAQWHASGHKAIQRIAVNVSPHQFNHPAFENDVIAALNASGINPVALELEVTENLLMSDVDEVSEKMSRLKALGVRFSIDDFGTGYSSLAYIKRLPINKIKIDQTFVRDILEDKDDASIVESTIAMAIKLGLELIAEGVETEGQQRFLQAHGCLDYQGYFYSKPLPADDFIRRIAELNDPFSDHKP